MVKNENVQTVGERETYLLLTARGCNRESRGERERERDLPSPDCQRLQPRESGREKKKEYGREKKRESGRERDERRLLI